MQSIRYFDCQNIGLPFLLVYWWLILRMYVCVNVIVKFIEMQKYQGDRVYVSNIQINVPQVLNA